MLQVGLVKDTVFEVQGKLSHILLPEKLTLTEKPLEIRTGTQLICR